MAFLIPVIVNANEFSLHKKAISLHPAKIAVQTGRCISETLNIYKILLGPFWTAVQS